MKNTFWFTVGAAAASFVIFRGKKLYREYLPESLRRQIEAKSDDAAIDFGRFSANFEAARAEREAEIRRELNIPEE